MKSLLFILLLLNSNLTAQVTLADSIITKSSLQLTVGYLSNDLLEGRLTGSAGADKAAAFIVAKFDSIGLNLMKGYDNFFDTFPIPASGKKNRIGKNVLAIIPGKFTNDSIVIFSAHYDHIGQRNDLPGNMDFNKADDIFNGANDNATGVAALIELAKYYKAANNNRYMLLFVAFAGEEMGMLGSTDLMKRTNPDHVKAVINLEMLGRPVKNNCFIISYNSNSVLKRLNTHLKQHQQAGEKRFFRYDPYPDENLVYRSDHYPFAKKIKQTFTVMGSSPADTYYHSVDDEYETIDFDFLLKATKNIALACETYTSN